MGSAFLALVLAASSRARASEPTLRVGSKRFVESYILAEVVTQFARGENVTATHKQGLGGTAVVFRALEEGAIDVYPEYTGTLAETVVKGGAADVDSLRKALAPRGIAVSDSLGFDNTYALAMSRTNASNAGVTKLSELASHPAFRWALSHEFLGRRDGWQGLVGHYGLRAAAPVAMDHALAYEAVSRGSADILDVYATDAKISRFDLLVLEDDRRFFPPYESVLVYRSELPRRVPTFNRILNQMRNAIDARTMRQMNARAELDGVPFTQVAGDFLAERSGNVPRPKSERLGLASGTLEVIRNHGPRHLMLVSVSLALSVVLGLPLGIFAYTRRRLGVVVLAAAGVVQTIPSLALFCFFIPLLGIGPVPALAALSLYGLLPIVTNTYAGLVSIPENFREAAIAIGLSRGERLRYVELPLASRTILAGIKTSAVVSVGSATIAAFIGAGGFGEPISTGLSLNDATIILEGAIPAAGLSFVIDGAFRLLERLVVPRVLRVKPR